MFCAWHGNRFSNREKGSSQQGVLMKTNKLQSKIRLFGLGIALLFGVGILSVTNVSAQNRSDRDYRQDDRDRRDDRSDRYDNNRSNSYRMVMQQGYREGMQSGREDARNNRRENAMRAYNRAVRDAR